MSTDAAPPSDDDHVVVSTTCETPVRFQTHKLRVNLQFHQHGLSPYWGLVKQFEPDHEDTLSTFSVNGNEWRVEGSTYWQGKIDDPSGNIDDGLNEYQYQVVAVDETLDRDATLQFRPGFPNTTHCDSGEPIQSIPDELPECLRVEVQSTNVELDELFDILQNLGAAIGLNPEYFGRDVHEWSNVSALEVYARVDRDVSDRHLTGEHGLLRDLVKFGSAQSGRGEYYWDHDDVQAYLERVGLDHETWAMLIPDQVFGKKVKSYHPKYPRDEDDGDPLYHPKLEVAYSTKLDDGDSVPLDAYDGLRDELQETGLNILHWAGLPVDAHDPELDYLVPDSYFQPRPADAPATLRSNPLPKLLDETRGLVETELAGASLGSQEKAVFEALTDGGARHYDDLAADADASSSTVYRLVAKLASLVTSDDGVIQFADRATREHVAGLVGRVRDTAEWARDSLREIAAESAALDRDGPLADWMERHGVRLVDERPDLHFELGPGLTERDVMELLRAGYQAALGSGLLTAKFLEAEFSWTELNGDRRQRWRGFVREGDVLGTSGWRILGKKPLDA